MISGQYFTYNGTDFTPYGLFFVKLNTEPNKKLGGDISYTTLKLKRNGRNTIVDTEYNDPLTFDAEIIRETIINKTDLITLQSLLFNDLNYKKLYILDDNGSVYDGIYYNCVFNNVEVIEGGGKDGWGIYGFKFTVVCDAAWAWEDEVTTTYNSTQLAGTITFNNTSDNKDYMYPTLIVTKTSSAGNIQIQCIDENNRLVVFTGLNANETITLDNELMKITSSTGLNRYSNFNKKFFRLLHGTNRFVVTGASTLKITYKNARKVN